MQHIRQLLFVSLILFSVQIMGQEKCGFDDILSTTNANSLSKENFDTIRARIRQKAAAIRGSNNPNGKIQQNNYVIPVVFHLVGTNVVTLTDAQITAQLAQDI